MFWKKILHFIPFAMFSCVVCSIIAMCLMWVVYLLPIEPIRNHTKASLSDLFVEPSLLTYTFAGKRLDVFTDSLMLSMASLKVSNEKFKESLQNKRPDIGLHPFNNLVFSLNNNEVLSASQTSSYARYWHGYLVLLKPLLMFTDLDGIRMGNCLLQSGLLFWALILMYKRFNILYALAFFIGIMVVNPVAAAWCLEYSPAMYILLVTVIYLLYHPSNDSMKVFLYAGIFLAFFDFPVSPVIALGIPLIVRLLQQSQPTKYFEDCVTCCMGWGIGYIGMWFCKWMLASIFTPLNVLADGFSQVFYRFWGDGAQEIGAHIKFSPLMAMKLNLLNFSSEAFLLIVLLYGGLCYLMKRSIQNKNCEYKKRFYILAVGFLPFIWYGLVVNHSIIHAWMTYKNLSVTVFAFLIYLACFIFDYDKKDESNYDK